MNQNIDFIEAITLHREANELKNLAIGTAAHDIRGPIGVIHSLAQLAGMATEESRREKYLKNIDETSKNTLELLDSLLNMTVIETGKITIEPDFVNLSDLVAQRVEFYHHISDNKDITIDCDLPELPDLRCDPERITQVIDNFVSNAIKYSPMHSEIEISIFETDGWHRLEISDHGCGISEENQTKPNSSTPIKDSVRQPPVRLLRVWAWSSAKILLRRTGAVLVIKTQRVAAAVFILCCRPQAIISVCKLRI